MTATTFAALQQRLLSRLHDQAPESVPGTMVVCPSLSFPLDELRKITGIQHYEERLLFCVLLLDNPQLEIVYLTSVPVDPAVIDYYLGWLPDPEHARRRLHLLTVDNADPRPLTHKLLERPDILAAVRDRVSKPEQALILPFNVTPAEVTLAEQLELPLYGISADHIALGSKSGARQVAVEAGVTVFEGAGDLHSVPALETAIHRLRTARPDLGAVVVKLNHGFSGQGNVIIAAEDLDVPLPQTPSVFCADDESWETFIPKIAAEGAVVEELVRGPGATSPSVQLRILPGGRSEVLSTHDQILGGPDDQIYLGCRFPAREEYRADITAAALRIAAVLAERGVIGSFGIDFVVVPGRGIFFSEINLRLGGTTHPFLMARHITGGDYDQGSGELLVDGATRVYKASDNIKSERYLKLSPAQVIAAVADAGLAYDPGSKTGATLHLLGAIPRYGKFGLVCIAPTHAEADELHDRVLERIGAATR